MLVTLRGLRVEGFTHIMSEKKNSYILYSMQFDLSSCDSLTSNAGIFFHIQTTCLSVFT